MDSILSDNVVGYTILTLDGLLLITSTVGMVLVVIRRNLHPLNQRSFVLVMLQNICMFLYPILSILDITGAIPCWIVQLLIFANYAVFGSDLVSITFRTFFKMRLVRDTTKILSHEHASLMSLHNGSWFVRNSFKIRDWVLVVGTLGYAVVATSKVFACQIDFQGAFVYFGLREDNYCIEGRNVVIVYSFLIISHILLDLFLWTLIEITSKDVRDGLHLKREGKV
jgi:hypothetical protein